jgi:glycosyltransferase involved in cell wall biosynthesis
LCEHLARAGCKVDLCTLDLSSQFGADVDFDESLIQLHKVPGRPQLSKFFVPGRYRQMISDLAKDADLIHCHGVWTAASNCGAQVAVKLGKPYVILPGGMFASSALGRSTWKKRLAALLYVRRNLRLASCLDVHTDTEYRDARSFGATGPIAVIPNGTNPDQFELLPPREAAWERWPVLRDKKLILFMARLHPIKGLPNLIEGWRRLAKDFDDWHLVIAGPDELGMRPELERLVSDGGVAECTTFTGPAFNEDKLALLAAANIYAQPSYSEGFSMAILEAMACAFPVLITTGCSFDDVRTARAGVIAESNADSVTEGLQSLLSMDANELAATGRRGKQLVRQRYSWTAITDQILSVYEWLLGRDDIPDCVRLD